MKKSDINFHFLALPPVQQPDPNQPKAEGAQMVAMRGEQLGVVTNWPPSLEAALQRWGTISPKAPCLTTMDTNGKPLYVLTYGKKSFILKSVLTYLRLKYRSLLVGI